MPVAHEPRRHRQLAFRQRLGDRPRRIDPGLGAAGGHPQRRRDQVRPDVDAVAPHRIGAVRDRGGGVGPATRAVSRPPHSAIHACWRSSNSNATEAECFIEGVDIQQRQATDRDKPRLEVQQILQRPPRPSIGQQRHRDRAGIAIDINIDIDVGTPRSTCNQAIRDHRHFPPTRSHPRICARTCRRVHKRRSERGWRPPLDFFACFHVCHRKPPASAGTLSRSGRRSVLTATSTR